MAQELANFAGGGGVVHDYRFDPELSEDIIEYIKQESDFRQFVKVITTDTYVMNLPRKWAVGTAVEIVEGSEIPKARDVFDVLSINIRAIGTGIKMTDEEQEMMGFDPNYFQTEARRATERLLKKENDDLAATLLAGSFYNVYNPTSNTLTFDDVVIAKTEMLENPYGINPDVILMSPRSYSDLLRDDDFKVYANSGISGVVASGDVGMYIDGMRIMIIPEVGDNVYLIDTSLDPIVLVQKGQVKTEKYRLSETREDVLDILLYEKPAILRPDAIAKIEVARNDTVGKRTFPEGWDPLTGYPARPTNTPGDDSSP